jgi:hypothetical protein
LYGLCWGNKLQRQIHLPTPDQSLFWFMLSRHETHQYLLYLWIQNQDFCYVYDDVVQSRIKCIGFNWNKKKIRSDRRPVYPNSKLILRINKDFHVHTPVMLSDERCSIGSRNSFTSLVRSAFAKVFFHLTQIPVIQQMLWLFRVSYSLTAVYRLIISPISIGQDAVYCLWLSLSHFRLFHKIAKRNH